MCRRFLFAGVLAATVVAAMPLSVRAQGPASDEALVVTHPVIAASVDRLQADSASWRDAMLAVAATGRRAVLLAADQVNGTFDSETLAQAVPLVFDQTRVDTVLVVVNLELLQRLSALPVEAAQFKDDLDRIIAHEVYGHAVPILLAGDLSGTCLDPSEGQRATSACAIQRENQIRKESGLGRRLEYGREGLSMARRQWQ